MKSQSVCAIKDKYWEQGDALVAAGRRSHSTPPAQAGQPHALADAARCVGGCSRMRRRMQPHALADAARRVGGCSALRWRMQPHALADAAACVEQQAVTGSASRIFLPHKEAHYDAHPRAPEHAEGTCGGGSVALPQNFTRAPAITQAPGWRTLPRS